MSDRVLIIHERIGFWVRRLRPRMTEQGLRIIETRSANDIDVALDSTSAPFPLALIDIGRRPAASLEELDRLTQRSPNALVLVLDPEAHVDLPVLAREFGATHVVSGPVLPPEVVRLLLRWNDLAAKRLSSAGRPVVLSEPPKPEPWNWISPLIGC